MTDFIYLGCKITVGSDCSHKIKRHLLLERKAMANLDSVIIKKQQNDFADKGPYSQSYGFPLGMYGCESWTINKAKHRTDAFELWF